MSMENDRFPSYYSVIPASVRYDRELSYFDVILFSELVAMSTLLGFCYASNSYLEKLYDVSTRTITRSIQNLSKRGHIYIVLDLEAENINRRKIYIVTPPIDKVNYRGVDKIVDTPLDKNVGTSRAGKASAFVNKHNSTKRSSNESVYELPEALKEFYKNWPK